jgi:FkbM family methyltransferase
MKTNMLDCTVIDAGARYGLHPSWAEMRGIATFHLFEMDPAEADRLARKYASVQSITVHPIALFSQDTTLRFKVSQHRALNSVYTADVDLLSRNEYMEASFAVVDEATVTASKIDSFFANQDIHFLKLDIEGAELEALNGAREKLTTSVLGVRSEVCFAPVYKGAPLFGDIHRELLCHGFELLNLDYTGQGNRAGRFAKPDRYGKLISSDAVWVVDNDRLFSRRGERLIHDVVRLSVFLMLNHAPDLALDTLLRAVTREGISFDEVREAPLFVALQRKALLHFKDLTSLPMFEKADLFAAYRTIFGADFPDLNKFYESDMFQ